MTKNFRNILILMILIFGLNQYSYATHAMGLDLTYQCLGNDQYHFTLSFYRDCDGVNAPNSVTIDFQSASCGQNFSVVFNKTSFQELNAVCASLVTTCQGGAYPGIEEHIYEATVTLPAKCSDWYASGGVCCRNNAINTINNPGGEDIFVKTLINNTVVCNNSPVFGVKPVPFMCATKTYCFNNGAADVDGDSLVYSMVTPTTGINVADTVQYVAGYSAQNPISSSPALSFDAVTGDLCMTPSMLGEVSVMQMLIEEYRNGVKIGSVERDIQLRVINCPNDNNLPYVNGINGTGDFSATICAGEQFTFNTTAVDNDATNNVTMSWNNGIPGASFNIAAGPRPVGTFSWTPSVSDISNNPRCFTVAVVDDNCPFLGSQVFSFCLTVVGVSSSITSTQNVDCNGDCDGTATAAGSGGTPPYTYLWDNGQATQTAVGLCAGAHVVTVTDDIGCSWPATANVTEPNLLVANITSYTDVLCFGQSTGSATVAASGGTGGYTFVWSDGKIGMSNIGLGAGMYTVTVTDSKSCVATTAVTISQPTPGLSGTSSATSVFCKSGNNGTATVVGSGGASGYTYNWDVLGVSQPNSTATGLSVGTYQYTITDNNGCKYFGSQNVTEPATVLTLGSSSASANCSGSNDGSVAIIPSGGNAPYTYQWDNTAGNATTSIVNNLPQGTYSATVTDANMCQKTINVAVGEPIQLDLTVNSTNTSCGFSNGSSSVSASGGTVPYSIVWSTGSTDFTITGQPSGFYTMTVTDANGCEKDTFAIMNDLTPNSSVLSTTDLTCYHEPIGEAELTVGGGLSPYTYTWSDGQATIIATGLSAGAHFVTVLDANSCLNIHVIILSEPSQISIGTDSIEVQCFGGNDGVASTNVTGGGTSYSYLWNVGGQTTTQIFGLSIGTYAVTVTDDQGCVRDTTIQITQPTGMSLSTTATDVACNGGSSGFGVVMASGGKTPYTYLWDAAAGNQMQDTAMNLFIGNFVVTVTDNNNCKQITSVNILQPTLFEVDTIFSNVSCKGGSDGSIQLNVSGGVTPYQYGWNNGNTNDNISGLTAAFYYATVTDANGCVENTSAFITQPSQLSMSKTKTDVNCYGDNDGSAIVLAFGGVTPYSYLWQNGQMVANGTQLYAGYNHVTITDFNNCKIVDSVFIDQPDTSIYITHLVLDVSCYGGSDGSIVVNPYGGTVPYSYSWDGPGENNTNKMYNLSVGVYSVTITDLNGCTYEDLNLTISEPADMYLITDSVRITCFGGSDGEASVTVAGGSTPYSFIWDEGQTTSSITGLVKATYKITVTDEQNCVEKASIDVTQPTLLVLSESSKIRPTCNGDNDASAMISAVGGTQPYDYLWGVEAAFQTGPVATGLLAGVYKATVTDVMGCKDSVTLVITQPDTLKIVTTPSADTICPGGNSLIGAMASGGNGSYTFHWDNGLGVGSTKSVAPVKTTTYNVYVNDVKGCESDSATVIVNVILFDIKDLEITSDGNVCLGKSTTLHSSFVEEYPPYTYNWSDGLGNSLGDIQVTPDSAKTYYVTVTDKCGKKLVDSISVMVYPLPEVLIDAIPDGNCAPISVAFQNSKDSTNILGYTWDFGDGTLSNTVSPTHNYLDEGVYEVSLEALTDNGCKNDPTLTTVFVTVNPTPVAEISASPQKTDTDSPTITFESLSIGADFYSWNFGDLSTLTDTSNMANVQYSYQDTGTYYISLIVENVFGCIDSAKSVVFITPVYHFTAPTAFIPGTTGPNGGKYDKENMNNMVFIPFTEYVAEFHMEVFNRWGELIFVTDDINVGWDGYYIGELCQQDVYVWKAKITYSDGSQAVKVGEIMLIR